jgi:hypothetical protein
MVIMLRMRRDCYPSRQVIASIPPELREYRRAVSRFVAMGRGLVVVIPSVIVLRTNVAIHRLTWPYTMSKHEDTHLFLCL